MPPAPLAALALALVALGPVRQGAPADDGDAARKAAEVTAREAAAARHGKGWKRFEVGPFLVFSEQQDALARELAKDAAVLWDWLADAFPGFAPGRYAPGPILIVHSTEAGAEQDGFLEGGYLFAPPGPCTLAVHPAPFAPSNVMRRTGEAWFQARDRDLYFALPGWLRSGLIEMFADARIKGGKPIFDPDTESLNDFAAALREDRVVPLRTFLRLPLARAASPGAGRDLRFSPSPQAGQLVRWLLLGKGARSAKARRILPAYVEAVSERRAALAAEVDAALQAAGVVPDAPEWSERRALEFERLEERMLPELFDRVFADWTDDDWQALEEYKFAR